jgi:hypothetical protein
MHVGSRQRRRVEDVDQSACRLITMIEDDPRRDRAASNVQQESFDEFGTPAELTARYNKR